MYVYQTKILWLDFYTGSEFDYNRKQYNNIDITQFGFDY